MGQFRERLSKIRPAVAAAFAPDPVPEPEELLSRVTGLLAQAGRYNMLVEEAGKLPTPPETRQAAEQQVKDAILAYVTSLTPREKKDLMIPAYPAFMYVPQGDYTTSYIVDSSHTTDYEAIRVQHIRIAVKALLGKQLPAQPAHQEDPEELYEQHRRHDMETISNRHDAIMDGLQKSGSGLYGELLTSIRESIPLQLALINFRGAPLTEAEEPEAASTLIKIFLQKHHHGTFGLNLDHPDEAFLSSFCNQMRSHYIDSHAYEIANTFRINEEVARSGAPEKADVQSPRAPRDLKTLRHPEQVSAIDDLFRRSAASGWPLDGKNYAELLMRQAHSHIARAADRGEPAAEAEGRTIVAAAIDHYVDNRRIFEKSHPRAVPELKAENLDAVYFGVRDSLTRLLQDYYPLQAKSAPSR